MTVNLILERKFDEPLRPEDVIAGGRAAAWCFDLHRVQWHGSFLSRDGHTLICRFSAPDMESARLAMRDRNMDMSRLWSSTVRDTEPPPGAAPTVVIERSFATPIPYEEILARGRAKSWCFETYRVRHSHSYCSLDGKRMLCFYAAPDAEAVRATQREAALPADSVWDGVLVVP